MNSLSNYFSWLLIGIALFSSQNTISSVLEVGPGKEFLFPSVAAQFAENGDTVEIDAGMVYRRDVAVWTQDNLTIKGVGGRPHLDAAGAHAEGKAIWVVKGNNTLIENIEFSGAKVPDKNGAGIRSAGVGLTIRRCYFHDNENGILGGRDSQSEIVIEHSEFARNGYGRGKTHNIYIGNVKRFVLRHNYIHHANVGHNVKSRAQENYILYNRIMDEEDGNSSYAIDIPNGGKSYVIGNLVQQGERAENRTILSYGAEGLRNSQSRLYVVNNTFVNDRSSGLFVKSMKGAKVFLVNNIFAGNGILLRGAATLLNNLEPGTNPGLKNRVNFDYRLTSGSKAINNGLGNAILSKLSAGFDMVPSFEYAHPAKKKKRPLSDEIDIGAYEFDARR